MKRALVLLLLLVLVAAGWTLSSRCARAVPESSAAIKDPCADPTLWRQCGPKHWRACLLQR